MSSELICPLPANEKTTKKKRFHNFMAMKISKKDKDITFQM